MTELIKINDNFATTLKEYNKNIFNFKADLFNAIVKSVDEVKNKRRDIVRRNFDSRKLPTTIKGAVYDDSYSDSNRATRQIDQSEKYSIDQNKEFNIDFGGVIYTLAPKILDGYITGITIRGTRKQFLAIPFRKDERNTKLQNGLMIGYIPVKLSPKKYETKNNVKLKFIPTKISNNFIGFLYIDVRLTETGRVGKLNLKRKSKKTYRTAKLLLYKLIREVKKDKLFDVDSEKKEVRQKIENVIRKYS